MRFRSIRRTLRSFSLSLAPLPSVVTLFGSTRPWDVPPSEEVAR